MFGITEFLLDVEVITAVSDFVSGFIVGIQESGAAETCTSCPTSGEEIEEFVDERFVE